MGQPGIAYGGQGGLRYGAPFAGQQGRRNGARFAAEPGPDALVDRLAEAPEGDRPAAAADLAGRIDQACPAIGEAVPAEALEIGLAGEIEGSRRDPVPRAATGWPAGTATGPAGYVLPGRPSG